jgi:hypothetical protein
VVCIVVCIVVCGLWCASWCAACGVRAPVVDSKGLVNQANVPSSVNLPCGFHGLPLLPRPRRPPTPSSSPALTPQNSTDELSSSVTMPVPQFQKIVEVLLSETSNVIGALLQFGSTVMGSLILPYVLETRPA